MKERLFTVLNRVEIAWVDEVRHGREAAGQVMTAFGVVGKLRCEPAEEFPRLEIFLLRLGILPQPLVDTS